LFVGVSGGAFLVLIRLFIFSTAINQSQFSQGVLRVQKSASYLWRYESSSFQRTYEKCMRPWKDRRNLDVRFWEE
jgi:hypothetical protein